MHDHKAEVTRRWLAAVAAATPAYPGTLPIDALKIDRSAAAAEPPAPLRSPGAEFGRGHPLSRPLTAPRVDPLFSVADVCERLAA